MQNGEERKQSGDVWRRSVLSTLWQASPPSIYHTRMARLEPPPQATRRHSPVAYPRHLHQRPLSKLHLHLHLMLRFRPSASGDDGGKTTPQW